MIFDLVRTIFPARNPVRARICQMLEFAGVWPYLTTFMLLPCIACTTAMCLIGIWLKLLPLRWSSECCRTAPRDPSRTRPKEPRARHSADHQQHARETFVTLGERLTGLSSTRAIISFVTDQIQCALVERNAVWMHGCMYMYVCIGCKVM